MNDFQLDLRMSYKEHASSDSMTGEERVFYMIVLLNPVTFEVVSLDQRSTLGFCLCGTSLLQKRGNMRINFIRSIDILSVAALWPDIVLRPDW